MRTSPETSWSDRLFVVVAALSAVLVLAQWVDWRLVRLPLAIVFILWVCVAFIGLLAPMTSLGRESAQAAVGLARGRSRRAMAALAAVGIAVALLNEVILGVLRLVDRNADLVFNIDNRFLLMHAWSIIRHEGAGQALSMVGTPISYHSGPAWFAAAMGSVFGTGPESWLFLWFPAAGVATIALSMFATIRELGAGTIPALVGMAIAFTPLWGDISVDVARAVASTLINAGPSAAVHLASEILLRENPTIMLNSLLGLAIVLAALGFFARRKTPSAFVAANLVVVLSSVAKPQYAISGSILLFGLGIALRRHLVALPQLGLPVVGALASVVLADRAVGGSSLAGARSTGWTLAVPDDWWSVDPFLPSDPRFVLISLGLTLGAVIVLRTGAGGFARPAVITSGIGLLGLSAFWALLNSVVAAGGDPVRTWAWNAMQAAGPVLTVSSAIIGAVTYAALERVSRSAVWIVAAALVVSVTASAYEVARVVRDPNTGHEAVDAPYVRELLREVDPKDAVILASDLSDPAQGHRRSGRAFYLSNAFGHQFWLTQTEYGHEQFAETERRVQALDRFFDTAWSTWHVDLLEREGITHVAISGRCPAVWEPDDVPMLTEAEAAGSWRLFEIAPPSSLWHAASEEAHGASLAEGSEATMGPLFGRAPCR